MKVKELIEELQKYDGENQMYIKSPSVRLASNCVPETIILF